MQSEEFDNKVKKAADRHYPAYDEQAWDKMEKLLNKHLPQEKDDRKRFIFFLLLFLLLGGSAWLVATKPWSGNKSSIAQVKGKDDLSLNKKPVANVNDNSKGDTRINTSANEQQEIKKPVTTTAAGTTEQPALNIGTNNNPVTSNNNSAPAPVVTKKKDKPFTTSIVVTKQQNTFFAAIPGIKKKQRRRKQNGVVSGYGQKQKDVVVDKGQDVVLDKPQQQKNNNELVPAIVNADVATTTTNTDISKVADNKNMLAEDSGAMKKDSPTDTVQTDKPVAQKVKNKKTNSFFFSLSTGPDVSFAGGDKMGKAKLVAGAGVGYTFKNRFTIRTGFYTGRKIYSASAAAYNPPADFYVYYPYLQKVDADCKVYEIPLLLSYHFGKSSKQNWFVSTGLSSFLMKSESYDYYYKYTATGSTMHKKWTIRDQNKHFFSILTLSGGYQRSLSKHFSILAEPFFKLPLSGVGYGRVKLNSAGILFSVAIKPQR